jgi:type I restriction enzyme S subunit
VSRYQSYPSYKDSGVGWLEEVPKHWGLKKIKYLFKIKKLIAGELGYNILSITQTGIKIKDTESGEGQLSMDYSKYQLVKAGDFAMNHMDLLTGYVDISKFDGVTSPDYRVFTANDKNCNHRYMLYLLQNGYKSKIFYGFGQGSSQLGRWRFPTEKFVSFQFPYPPENEQATIANFLDQEIEKIDLLVQKQLRMLELLKEKRQASVDSIIKQNRTVSMRLGKAVNQIFRPVNRIMDETYVALGLYNRGRGIFHKEPKEGLELGDSDFHWIEDGDLILSGQFAWEGSVALAGKTENNCIVSHRYPVIRGKDTILNTEYLWAFLTTKAGDFLLNEHSVGSAGRNRPLNINTLLKENIPIPTMEAQMQILKIVNVEQSIKKLIQKTFSLLQERRTALISAAVTGKIDVRGYNVG